MHAWLQVVCNSASNLIRNTFTFEKVGPSVSERFWDKAQFSLKDVKVATDDLILLKKLVKLLACLQSSHPHSYPKPALESPPTSCLVSYAVPELMTCASVPANPTQPL